MGNGLVWILSEFGGNIFFVRSDITLGHNCISFKIIFSSVAVSRLFVRTLNDGVGILLQVIMSILTRQENSLHWRLPCCKHAIYYEKKSILTYVQCTHKLRSLIHIRVGFCFKQRIHSSYNNRYTNWYTLLMRIETESTGTHIYVPTHS